MNSVILGSRFGEWVGTRVIMPLVARAFWFKLKHRPRKGALFIKQMEDAVRANWRHEDTKKHRYDIISSFLLYSISPAEYSMYRFHERNAHERDSYVGDYELDLACATTQSWETFKKLRDKWTFYRLTKPYFRRDVCAVYSERDMHSFVQFAQRHRRFFFKANNTAFGRGCRIVDVPDDAQAFFREVGEGDWLAEELIVQTPDMAEWNESSVNTVRLCSFRKGDKVLIRFPFIRVGRKGSVVDNGGQGGIFASIDVDSGIICTDGGDETGRVYTEHPDSGKPFKGVQIRRWRELLALCKEVHLSMPAEFFYVGFDFALTDTGWVLVEGNWGEFVAQQTTLGRGLRREFEELMGVEAR